VLLVVYRLLCWNTLLTGSNRLNRQNDLELEELLKTTKLLEEYTAEELGGKDRRKKE